ncbi:Putative AC transposase [Linum perenne]
MATNEAPTTNEASNPMAADSPHAEESAASGSGTGSLQPKKTKLRSPHWIGFTTLYCMEGNPPREVRYGKCDRCGTIIKANSSNSGTNGLKNHHESCERKFKESKTQPKLSYQVTKDGVVSKEDWVFNAEEVRLALAEIIILDELPFRFVERLGFIRFMTKCCPMFAITGRRAIRDDCARLFLERKDILKSFFSSKRNRKISVTTDCWTNLRNQNFICVTVHFIGKNWYLHKKIIAFRLITSHKGEDVANSIMEVLNEWDIRSLICCTVDNASSNDAAIRHMRERLQLWGGNTLGGKYLHMRCVAHIINLIVQDGLEEIGISIRRVREACKWIKASPARIETFKRAAANMLLTCKHELMADMPTRWTATYTMLEHAEPY